MARCLQIGIRSYYDWRSNKYGKRENNTKILEEKIKDCFEVSLKTYGSVRLTVELNMNNTPVSRTTVLKYMRGLGLRSILAHKFKVCTTDSKHNNHIAENLLDRNFTVAEPNKVWVSDITYIHTKTGFDYLTTIIDLFDRKIIGLSQSSDMTTSNTVIVAFNMAIKHRSLSVTSANGLMLHSDR